MKIIWHWLILTIVIIATKFLLPGSISINPLYVAFAVSACLIFVNFAIKPIISLLTLPINIMTLGLFGLILNGLIFYTIANVIPGFSVSSFKYAVIAAVIVSFLNWILGKIFG